ncbi:putative bifunctional diguanylate cyclase/phosphodiesterase [Virgisporangium aurantiacum]|uniref:GGDEF domain-containing protein n=1 Tax=Virgisporangium aurantiacum TaxID=175570 RepID=A0A8J4E5Z4_9ACTN|nr:GGDEF domain-containing protein [Virgisporangium aurantiacum]
MGRTDNVTKAQRRKPAEAVAIDGAVPAAKPVNGAPADQLDPAVAKFAQRWLKAVRRIGFAPMGPDGLYALLRDLAAAFVRAVHDDPFDPAAATRIGAALAEAGLTDPGVLTASLSVLRNPPRLGSVERRASRIADLHAGLAGGYAAALRRRTLREQEHLAHAITAAHAQVEHQLWTSESRFRALFEGAAMGIVLTDLEGRIIQANIALARLLGYPLEELYRLETPDFLHPADLQSDRDLYADLVRGDRDHLRMEKAYFRKDGTVVWTDLTITLLRGTDGNPTNTVAMIEDVTDRHELEERLRHQALHDPLTGLPNRTHFAERLAEAFANPDLDAQVGLCYLDLDGFKRINDSLGHDVGDKLLVAVSRRLERTVSNRGYQVARMGGDEFVILAEKATLDELTALADQVLYSLDLPVRSGPHGMRVSASIGIVVQSVGSSGPAEILKAADLTLYRAKAAGRSRWACYDAKLNEAQVARYALVEKLPDAVQRGEFSLLYQPLVSTATGRACGVEALLRWDHPERGTLSPDEFIDLAEETGIISAIGTWVLREACRQGAKWWRRFPERSFYVSVNVATAQTYDPALVGDVLSILDESGLPATLLQLELTESAMLSGGGEPVEALRELAAAGIRIAIDDFGTGYSNLAYLRTLPVAGLKLARQFTDGLGRPVDTHIVKTLIELAHVLDLAVTAEGVETPDQLAQLKAMNCDVLQGWHLSMPLPADEMSAVLENGG